MTMLISPVHRSDNYPRVTRRYLHASPHVHNGKLRYAVHYLGRNPAHGRINGVIKSKSAGEKKAEKVNRDRSVSSIDSRGSSLSLY